MEAENDDEGGWLWWVMAANDLWWRNDDGREWQCQGWMMKASDDGSATSITIITTITSRLHVQIK